MKLSNSVNRVLVAYLRMVDRVTAGARLQQVWNALSAQQQSDILDIIRPHYVIMFGGRTTGDEFGIIGECAEVLTPQQRDQLLNLLKNDVQAAFDTKKAAIDAQANEVAGGQF
jgi:hypothetical protein